MNPLFKKTCDLELGFIIDVKSGSVICNNDLSPTTKNNAHELVKEQLFKNFWTNRLGFDIISLGINQDDISLLFSVSNIEPIDYASYMRYHIIGYLQFKIKDHASLFKIAKKDYYNEGRHWIHIDKRVG